VKWLLLYQKKPAIESHIGIGLQNTQNENEGIPENLFLYGKTWHKRRHPDIGRNKYQSATGKSRQKKM
jgi:hypothetical protein